MQRLKRWGLQGYHCFNYGELLLCALEPDTAAQLLAANNHRHLYQASLEHHDILGTSLLELQQAYGLQQKLPRLLLELTHLKNYLPLGS